MPCWQLVGHLLPAWGSKPLATAPPEGREGQLPTLVWPPGSCWSLLVGEGQLPTLALGPPVGRVWWRMECDGRSSFMKGGLDPQLQGTDMRSPSQGLALGLLLSQICEGLLPLSLSTLCPIALPPPRVTLGLLPAGEGNCLTPSSPMTRPMMHAHREGTQLQRSLPPLLR